QRELPVSEQSVRQPVPVVAELPASSKRQIVQDAGRKVVIQIDLRQTPVEVFPVGQREVRRARQRAETITQAVVIRLRIRVAEERIQTVLRRLRFRLNLQ